MVTQQTIIIIVYPIIMIKIFFSEICYTNQKFNIYCFKSIIYYLIISLFFFNIFVHLHDFNFYKTKPYTIQ